MNVSELRGVLRELGESPLELLNATDMRKFADTFKKMRDQIQKTSVLVEVQNLNLEIPHSERALFELLMKAKKIRKPAKSAPLGSYVAYEKQYRTAVEGVRRVILADNELLSKIKALPEKKALERLAGLDTEARKRLSRLANLTKQSGRGVSLFSLTTSKKNHQSWLSELQAGRIDPELFA